LQENATEAIDGLTATTGDLLDATWALIINQLNQTVAALNPVGLLSVLDPLPVKLDIPLVNSAGVICAATECAPAAGSTEADRIWVAPPTTATTAPSEISAPFKTVAYKMEGDEEAADDGTGYVEAPTRFYAR